MSPLFRPPLRFLLRLCLGSGLALAAAAAQAQGALTAEERAWAAAHPVIKVAASRTYGPFTYVDDSGAVRGLSVDYLNRLRELTGLNLKLQPPMAFADSMQALKSGELDLIMSLRETDERRTFLSFTRPYISVPAVLLRRRADGAGAPAPSGAAADELRPGEPVSVSRGYAVGPFLAERFPGNPQQIESDDRSLLRRLAGGEIVAGVMDLAGATYLMRTEGIGNVRVAGDVGFAYDLGVGYRRDWPLLGRILQKGLDQIDAAERQAIADRWIARESERGFWRREVVLAAAGMIGVSLLALGAMWAWNRALAREVAARTAQLQLELAERRRLQDADSARAVAELANRAKTEFMSQASHELRTPLNAVLGFAQLLESDPQRPLDALQAKRVGHIADAADHLLVLIDDMMSLSRLEAGNLAVTPRAVEIGPLLRRCVALAAPAAGAAGITVHYDDDDGDADTSDGPGSLPQVLADPVRLEQVLHNLLSNAIKYNRPGGWVRVGAAASGPAGCRIAVADNGLGMTAEQLAQLFQAFNRLGRHEHEGTGIGLVICKQLMERMGGRIEVESEAGAGSRFMLELRAVPPER